MARYGTALLLHTLGMDASSWRRIISDVDNGPIPLAVDLPAHGTRRAEPFRLDRAREVALAALERLGRPPFHLVGSGLGALVALELHGHGLAPASLTLCGWPPVQSPDGADRVAATRRAIDRDGMTGFAESYLRQALVDPGQMAELLPAMSGLLPAGITGSLEAALRWDGAALRPTGTPTLVLRGALDDRVTEPAARALAAALGGRFEQVPGAGHLAYLDRPREFGAALAAFHRRVGTGPGWPATAPATDEQVPTHQEPADRVPAGQVPADRIPVGRMPRPHRTAPEGAPHRRNV